MTGSESPIVRRCAHRYAKAAAPRLWANTFTMVLDPAVPAGRALVVPPVREVETIEDLVDGGRSLVESRAKPDGW